MIGGINFSVVRNARRLGPADRWWARCRLWLRSVVTADFGVPRFAFAARFAATARTLFRSGA
jgi:hypothetical protein